MIPTQHKSLSVRNILGTRTSFEILVYHFVYKSITRHIIFLTFSGQRIKIKNGLGLADFKEEQRSLLGRPSLSSSTAK